MRRGPGKVGQLSIRSKSEPVSPALLSQNPVSLAKGRPRKSGSLLDRYRIWQGQLNGEPALLVAIRAPGQGATAEFIKHRELLRRQLRTRLVLLLLEHVPAVIRRQMVERQVGFLAPGCAALHPRGAA